MGKNENRKVWEFNPKKRIEQIYKDAMENKIDRADWYCSLIKKGEFRNITQACEEIKKAIKYAHKGGLEIPDKILSIQRRLGIN